MRAMVLAAGVGSRLEPLTARIPKPLVPVANRPVMELILQLLKRHGIEEVISNLHHLPEALRQYFGDGSKLGMRLSFHEEAMLSGDAGGVRACRDFLESGTFLVIMGDLLTDADITFVVAEHRRKRAIATIGLKRVDDVTQFGVAVTDQRGFITGFQEKPEPAEALSNLASTGIYVLEPEIFEHIPAQGTYGFGRQLFPKLVASGLPVLGVEITSYWSDVGTMRQYRLSNFDALEGRIAIEIPGARTARGWIGEGASVDGSCLIDGVLLLGKRSRLGPGTRVKGRVIVGDDCLVEGAELEDTIVWSGATLPAGTKLKDCIVGHGCVVKDDTNQTNSPAASQAAAGAKK